MIDPRTFPDPATAPPDERALHDAVTQSLTADTAAAADASDRAISGNLARRLAEGDGTGLASLFGHAPSVAVTRHLWRLLDALWRDGNDDPPAGVAVTVFALPLIIVTGAEGATETTTNPGMVRDPERLALILREHGALGGNRSFAFADSLVAAEAIDIARLPEIFAWRRLPDAVSAGALLPIRMLAPAPLTIAPGQESVHLRFLVGTALAKSGVDLLRDSSVGRWGVPLTQQLVRDIGVQGATVLALPRAPQRLLPAVRQGRIAQREVGAQIFATNAIRRIRASVGEPTAIISAHRAADAPGGGELRLSLSSPFEPRDAEGLRCPLHPQDRVGDVVTMLADLMRDCRVTDVRVLEGVHADRIGGTGLPLLFKPDTIPASNAVVVH